MFDFLRIPKIPTPTNYEAADDSVTATATPAEPDAPPVEIPVPAAESPTPETESPVPDDVVLTLLEAETQPELTISDLIKNELEALDRDQEAVETTREVIDTVLGIVQMDYAVMALAIEDEIAEFTAEKKAELAQIKDALEHLTAGAREFDLVARDLRKDAERRRKKLRTLLD